MAQRCGPFLAEGNDCKLPKRQTHGEESAESNLSAGRLGNTVGDTGIASACTEKNMFGPVSRQCFFKADSRSLIKAD
ncbi:hypothetical protein [Brevibacillus sp. MCWH]|jgi:hypothetical protein|uniref:hypothetical protein n=1 Tax=Brevibacillus sp. MCWH TaxID=2508871 RepID=UPI0014916223|nr:hypothetical protein [Brevibacillus sp. MCWH]MBR8661300.1 hypothetical protein [Brevibacillus sp. NL20B1]